MNHALKNIGFLFVSLFFMPFAFAEGEMAATGESAGVTGIPFIDSIIGFAPIILIVAVFYFLVMRPQQKRTKAHRELLSNVKVGDEVVLAGGIVGELVKLGDQLISVQTDKETNTVLRFQRQAITSILPKGTLESFKNESA